MATGTMYGQFETNLGLKKIDFSADTFKAMLCTSTYTPSKTGHAFKSDVTNELSTGGGYTAGGVTLTSVTWAFTAADSWGFSRANSTAYQVGDLVRPASANGFLYRCVVAGTTGGSVPTYPTVVGQTVTDGGVTWVCSGFGVTRFDCADPSWSSATFTARYLVVYDNTPATDATRPLICYIDFGSDQSPAGVTFTYQVRDSGMAYLLAA